MIVQEIRKKGAAFVVALSLLAVGCSEAVLSADLGPDAGLLTFPDEAIGAEVSVDNGQNGETVRVPLVSWRDMPFRTVKRQAYDYSCGSAAVATLMSYAYGVPVSEKEVFKGMFDRGDQAKIQREGFSMLDMSNYLNTHGLNAKGYRLSLGMVEKYRLPFIALVNNKGYSHFLVVKSVDGGRVLVGDPNLGNLKYSREDFQKIWNGLALVVINNATKGRQAFESPKEWRLARASAPVRDGAHDGTDAAALSPMAWQVAPLSANVMPATMTGLVATTTLEGGL